MKKRNIFLIIAFGLIFLIVSIEIYLRITNKQKLAIWKPVQYIADSLIHYRYKPNIDAFRVNSAYINYYVTNSYGFTGDDFSAQKTNGFYRIILLASSNETGIATNDFFSSYPVLVKDSLKSYNDSIEFINCSIDGKHSGICKINMAYNELLKYQPDLILMTPSYPLSNRTGYRKTYGDALIYYYNSYNQDLTLEKKRIDDYYANGHWFKIIYKSSYILRYACRNEKVLNLLKYKILKRKWWIPELVMKNFYVVEPKGEIKRYSKEFTMEKYVELNNYLDSLNIDLVFYDLFKIKDSDIINEEFSKAKLDYINLAINYRPEINFGKLDGHLNSSGHKEVADKLYMELMNNLIPSQYLKQSSN